MSDSSGFLAAVAEWLRTLPRVHSVASVEKVDGSGTDWAGSTEEGFRSRFDVTISYVDADGNNRSEIVEGDEMASLWEFIVSRWP